MIDYPYQYLPPLKPEIREALKESIRESGVLVAVEKDEAGNILDGHHRLEICEELGITEYPVSVRLGLSEEEKIRHVITVNENRRPPEENNKQFAAVRLRQDRRNKFKSAPNCGNCRRSSRNDKAMDAYCRIRRQ